MVGKILGRGNPEDGVWSCARTPYILPSESRHSECLPLREHKADPAQVHRLNVQTGPPSRCPAHPRTLPCTLCCPAASLRLLGTGTTQGDTRMQAYSYINRQAP